MTTNLHRTLITTASSIQARRPPTVDAPPLSSLLKINIQPEEAAPSPLQQSRLETPDLYQSEGGSAVVKDRRKRTLKAEDDDDQPATKQQCPSTHSAVATLATVAHVDEEPNYSSPKQSSRDH